MPTPFKFLPLGAVKPVGWILEQLRQDLSNGFAGCLDALTERAATDLFSHRIESSTRQFAWWDSETRGNWLWGLTMMAGLADLPESQKRVAALLDVLKQSQDPDGYIGIYSPESRYQHGKDENGELWGQSRALLALLSQYELSGDQSCLRAAQAAADLTLHHYGPHNPYFRQPAHPAELIGMTHGLCYVDVMEWLYALTGDTRYRVFGVWLYQDFNRLVLPFSNDDLTLSNLLDPNQYFHGHAVHTVEHLRALLFALQNGALPQGAQALDKAFWKLRHYTLPSGAVLGDEGLHGLPTPEIGYEYCTITELLFSLTSALQKLGDPTLGDWIETLTFNAAQGARFADGRGLAYLSLDTRLSASNDRPDSYSHLLGKHGWFKYSPTHEDVACCCNPNALRLMPHYISRMWFGMTDRPGFAAALYGPCVLNETLNGVNVTIVEETTYPFLDTVRFTVTPEQPLHFAIKLRKPAWAGGLEIPGLEVQELEGWWLVEKTWMPGDSFMLSFKPRVELQSYPGGEYAVRRGALQYALPVDFELRPFKTYPLPGFYDYEVFPHQLEQAYVPFVLDAALPGYGLSFEQDLEVDDKQVWKKAPVWLKKGEQVLVPLGCTVLRRAAFPLKQVVNTAMC
jgi:DUF1680 family protein